MVLRQIITGKNVLGASQNPAQLRGAQRGRWRSPTSLPELPHLSCPAPVDPEQDVADRHQPERVKKEDHEKEGVARGHFFPRDSPDYLQFSGAFRPLASDSVWENGGRPLQPRMQRTGTKVCANLVPTCS